MMKGLYADAHIHIGQLPGWRPYAGCPVCACCLSAAELDTCRKLQAQYPELITIAFGIHPQQPDTALLPYLERRAREGSISCVGEAGFDFYEETDRAAVQAQTDVWRAQLEIAARFGLPLAVHCRKALDRVFADSRLLAALPAVIFHAFPGTPEEARSLHRRGVAAYFSLGRELVLGRKQSLRCAAELEPGWLLAETDAPHPPAVQRRLGVFSIACVYKRIAELRDMPLGACAAALAANFTRAFARRSGRERRPDNPVSPALSQE